MRVSDVMTRDVECTRPDATLQEAARRMRELDVGALPVGKTRVLRFDLGAKIACSDVSRVVLDEVTSCSGSGLAPADCLAAVALSSRAGVKFDF